MAQRITKAMWKLWHIYLRKLFDYLSGIGYGYQTLDSRPWYHLCCNGDAGGWRTKFCDCLENHWRYVDD